MTETTYLIFSVIPLFLLVNVKWWLVYSDLPSFGDFADLCFNYIDNRNFRPMQNWHFVTMSPDDIYI